MTTGVDIEGVSLRAMILGGTIGAISAPNTEENYGLGWHPSRLRPDGTDPNHIDHTFARDWIAFLSVKTATKITGVPVAYRNRNLCAEDQWRGPDEKGRYYCKEPYYPPDGERPPDENIWLYDYSAYYYSYEPIDYELRPLMTLAATGWMDPKIPGGHVSQIFGSKELADSDWESCAWPDTFEPDEMLSFGHDEEPLYTHTSQTYRFSKDPERGVRVTLSTTWRRGFCPGAVEE